MEGETLGIGQRKRTRYQQQQFGVDNSDVSAGMDNQRFNNNKNNPDFFYSANKGFSGLNRLESRRSKPSQNVEQGGIYDNGEYQLIKSIRYRTLEDIPFKIYISLE